MSGAPRLGEQGQGVEYRQGLPSVEDVRAHEERGGRWQTRRIYDDGSRGQSVIGDILVRQDAAWTTWRIYFADGPRFHAREACLEGFPEYRTGWEYRPCAEDGTPCPWPGAAPAAQQAPVLGAEQVAQDPLSEEAVRAIIGQRNAASAEVHRLWLLVDRALDLLAHSPEAAFREEGRVLRLAVGTASAPPAAPPAPASPCKTCGAALVEPTATHCWPRCAQVPAPASLPVVDPLREAAQEVAENDALRERMSSLLTQTADALKGDPGALRLHDWSNLPKVAAEMRQAIVRYVAAVDARIAASRERARVEVETTRKWPRSPKRIPRNAVNLADLSPEEQAAHERQCAEGMAPIDAANKAATDAQAEESAALTALRSALSTAPLPVVQGAPAPGERLTLERLLRTAVQVALTTAIDNIFPDSLKALEDRALERVQALLTPAGRLALAAELLAGVPRGAGAVIDLGANEDALALLLGLGAPMVTTPHVMDQPPRAVFIDSATLQIGVVTVRAQGRARPIPIGEEVQP